MAAKRPLVNSAGTPSELTNSDTLQIPVVAALPGGGSGGEVVYLSTDGQLYRWSGVSSSWGAIGGSSSRAFAFFS